VERPGGLGYISKLARRSAKAIRRELRAGNRELPGEEVEDVASKRDAAAERVA
jgi:hypothetical protein